MGQGAAKRPASASATTSSSLTYASSRQNQVFNSFF
jgi:hypothetical protein